MPEGAIYVGRPGYWGNPFRIGDDIARCYGGGTVASRERAVELFREYLRLNPIVANDARRRLRGFNLACWCPLSEPCHADVLLEVANS